MDSETLTGSEVEVDDGSMDEVVTDELETETDEPNATETDEAETGVEVEPDEPDEAETDENKADTDETETDETETADVEVVEAVTESDETETADVEVDDLANEAVEEDASETDAVETDDLGVGDVETEDVEVEELRIDEAAAKEAADEATVGGSQMTRWTRNRTTDLELYVPMVSSYDRPRRLPLVLAGIAILLGAGIAFIVASGTPEEWVSVSELEYRGESFVETAAISAASRNEIDVVAQSFGLSADEVEEQFSVRHPPNSEILELRYVDEDRSRSLAVLRALTELVTDRAADSGLVTQIDILDGELERVRSERDDLRDSVDTPSTVDTLVDPATSAAIEELAVLSRQVADLELRLVDLELRRVEKAPVLVTAPYTETQSTGPEPLRSAVLGGIAGTAVALLVLISFARLR